MAALLTATASLTMVRPKATSACNGESAPDNRKPPAAAARPFLSISKPSWVVRTESNVRRESFGKPDPPCVVCRGSGRVDCQECNGRGRKNHIELTMLPKGEWPKWCRSCGGSGLGYCNRCLGTGEYRYIMGFHFMKKDSDRAQDNQMYKVLEQKASRSSLLEMLENNDKSDPGSER